MKWIPSNDSADRFFEMLPLDWQEGIVPYWEKYKNETNVFCWIDSSKKVIGGGLIFDELSPDMEMHRSKLCKYLTSDSKYLGFIWIDENYRSMGLGKKWLENVIEYYPQYHLWLSIEEESLKNFYQKLGFEVTDHLLSKDSEEWMMRRPKSH
jgi:GNAT superfamily N-acetyltransferase